MADIRAVSIRISTSLAHASLLKYFFREDKTACRMNSLTFSRLISAILRFMDAGQCSRSIQAVPLSVWSSGSPL